MPVLDYSTASTILSCAFTFTLSFNFFTILKKNIFCLLFVHFVENEKIFFFNIVKKLNDSVNVKAQDNIVEAVE
jgi:hypothetical protein